MVASLTVAALAGPAVAMPAPAVHGRAALSCPVGVLGVTSSKALVLRSVVNGAVTKERVSSTKLSFDPTALGFVDYTSTATTGVQKLSAMRANGAPRQIRLTFPLKGTALHQTSAAIAQKGFAPRLFADSIGYFVYTVNGSGVLERWEYTRSPKGAFSYAARVKLGSGYGKLRSLQNGGRLKASGVEKDLLYATTSGGALLQIAIPLGRPTREKVTRLKASGYTGVTEISTSYCNDSVNYHALVTINPSANTATWTTVQGANKPSSERTVLQGAVTGSTRWNLHAVL